MNDGLIILILFGTVAVAFYTIGGLMFRSDEMDTVRRAALWGMSDGREEAREAKRRADLWFLWGWWKVNELWETHQEERKQIDDYLKEK